MAMMEQGQGSGGRLSVRISYSIPSGKASACPHQTGASLVPCLLVSKHLTEVY